MPECPVCFGEKVFDLRDSNAYLKEHLPDHVCDFIGLIDEDFLECDECEGTGVVSRGRLIELRAGSKAAVDQILAELDAERIRLKGAGLSKN